MPVSARECVAALLADHTPATVLVIGDSPFMPEIEAELQSLSASDATEKLGGLGRFDFVVISGLTESLAAPAAEALLGRLKNLHADKFLLLVDPAASSLSHDDLLALALAPFEHLEDGQVAWRYDIDLYNPERRWNNPEDWANPENFERFRW